MAEGPDLLAPTRDPESAKVEEWVAGRDCPLCGGPGTFWGEAGGYPLRECCGVLLSWQWPNEETYLRLYTEPNRYHAEQQRREGQASYWERESESLLAADSRLQVYRSLGLSGGRLLDVGCATGALISRATAHGWDAVGWEPNAQVALAARGLQRAVRTGDWEAAVRRELPGSWDLITLIDVLEHLTRPAACLQELRSLLAPAGRIVVEWPEWGCQQAQEEGVRWKHIRPLQHPCLFSHPAALRLFQSCGLEVVAVHYPLGGSLGKASYILQARPSVLPLK